MTSDQFRQLALCIPDVIEAAHVGHPDFRLAGKVFASLGSPTEEWGMVKLTPEQQADFIEKAPDVFRPCSGAWGRRGYTNVLLELVTKKSLQEALDAAAKNVLLVVKVPGRAKKTGR